MYRRLMACMLPQGPNEQSVLSTLLGVLILFALSGAGVKAATAKPSALREEGGHFFHDRLHRSSSLFKESVHLSPRLKETGVREVSPGDSSDASEGRFEKVVLTRQVSYPMELAVAPDGRVFIAERDGVIKMWSPKTGSARMVGFLRANMIVEDGLLGLTLDPNFQENGWLYVYYAPEDGGPNRLSRLTFREGKIDMSTEEIVLEVPVQRKECCHSGGSLTFGPDGNLYLSTGDNTNPYPLGGSAMDERPGHRVGDAQRTAANTNDLRGKILRIRPTADGGYTIPEGNLFEGDSLHRPEIYTMGHRNPYRISVDPETGWLYWGDVGIGNAPSEERGPWGWEEFNQAKKPGFYGWPYFVGPNDAYRDYNYATEEAGGFFNPERPLNESPNNTGVRQLPPAQPAMIWYTYNQSEEFPELGAGGMSAMAGPVYRYDAETASPHALPARYDGSLFVYDWMRSWIKEVQLEEDGDLAGITPFLPEKTFTRPMDMEIGPRGRLHVIEWGQSFWGANRDAQVVRIDYHEAKAPSHEASAGHQETTQAAAAKSSTAPAVEIVWPPEGSFFEYGTPIPYQVKRLGEGGQVEMRSYSGHDKHEHLLSQWTGKEGSFSVTTEYAHVPDMYLLNRYGVLEARQRKGEGASAAASADRVILQPKRKEAEHFSRSKGAERETFGKHPAEPDFAETAFTAMAMDRGDELVYKPVNLANIEALRFKVKPGAEGVIEVRLDSLEGQLVAEVPVGTAARLSSKRDALQVEAADLEQGELIGKVPENVQSAYRGWKSVKVPIEDPGGTHALHLVVRGESEEASLQLDYIDFLGEGAAVKLSE